MRRMEIVKHTFMSILKSKMIKSEEKAYKARSTSVLILVQPTNILQYQQQSRDSRNTWACRVVPNFQNVNLSRSQLLLLWANYSQ